MGRQPDLLDWQPPAPVEAFPAREVAGATLAAKISRAIAAVLKTADDPREEIAERMSAFLGVRVSVNMLNAYASAAREDQSISVVRLLALVHATGDRRLLHLLAEQFGWAVVPEKYLRLIELAAVREREDVLRRRAETIRKEVKREGLL